MPLKRRALEFPSRLGLTRLWRSCHRGDVPVLFLHGVLPDKVSRPFNASGKFVSPERLRRFLAHLGRAHKFIGLDDYLDHLYGRRSLSGSLLLTFDDGYANNHEHALPLLSGLGVPFAVFVATGFVGTRDVMWTDRLEYAVNVTRRTVLRCGIADSGLAVATAGQKAAAIATLRARLKRAPSAEARARVREICAALDVDPDGPELDGVRFLDAAQIRGLRARGVAIGSHTVSHAILARESAEDARREIVLSRERLEEILGEPVRHFAYPNGRREDFDENVKGALREAGYVSGFSTIAGISRPGDDPFEVRRFAVNGRATCRELETRISGLLEFLKGRP